MRLIFALAVIAPLHAQQFDVASVKVALPPDSVFVTFTLPAMGGPGTTDPTHITWNNVPLRMALRAAYDVRDYQVDAPGWLGSERYDFVVSVPQGATKEQVRVMWQKLLAERFGMAIHHESREFQVDALVVARGGHKLKETAVTGPVEGPPKVENDKLVGPGLIMMMRSRPTGVVGELMGVAQPLSNLATLLGNQLGHQIVDNTGLAGKYDFTVEFSPVLSPGLQPGLDPSLDIGTAVQQTLGLRLEKGKGMLDVIVVDKAEKVPTEN